MTNREWLDNLDNAEYAAWLDARLSDAAACRCTICNGCTSQCEKNLEAWLNAEHTEEDE